MRGIGSCVVVLGVVLAGSVGAALPPREDAAIQAQINAAFVRGGGTVNIPAGRHVVGQLDLKSGVELHLEKGAVLEGTSDRTAYPKFTRPYHRDERARDRRDRRGSDPRQRLDVDGPRHA